ncbi:MAG: TlpA family protein disulfide reductase [Rubripirellula sp.]
MAVRTPILLVCVAILSLGCSQTPADPYAASKGDPSESLATTDIAPDPTLAEAAPIAASEGPYSEPELSRRELSTSNSESLQPSDLAQPEGVVGTPSLDRQGMTPRQVSPGNVPLKMAPAAASALGQLKPDLPPADLVKFLAGADNDMRLIHSGQSGITDPQEARRTLLHIIKMKLEASKRLTVHAEATEAQKSEGARGELQSLSHLASLGDLKSAEELELLAESKLESSDDSVAADSRLVLIGFAMESLQNGNQDSVQKILDLVTQIATSKTPADVPAMIVMGQARQVLEQYGHATEARRVRDTIIDLFADSPNPEIAEMAAQQAGSVRFDAINDLHKLALDGGEVTSDQWTESVESLIKESADLQTVQYLAGCALEFESFDMNDLAAATYQTMSARFDDPQAATGRETILAIGAYRTRQNVIGSEFTPTLNAIDGSEVRLADYRGKVTLMPLWAASFPESLQLVPDLIAIRELHPEKVEIVGINLDMAGAPLEQFPELKELGFVNLRSETAPKQANPIAVQFGMVSMPFLVILDQEGRVAALNFTGRNLKQTVEKLLNQ